MLFPPSTEQPIRPCGSFVVELRASRMAIIDRCVATVGSGSHGRVRLPPNFLEKLARREPRSPTKTVLENQSGTVELVCILTNSPTNVFWQFLR